MKTLRKATGRSPVFAVGLCTGLLCFACTATDDTTGVGDPTPTPQVDPTPVATPEDTPMGSPDPTPDPTPNLTPPEITIVAPDATSVRGSFSFTVEVTGDFDSVVLVGGGQEVSLDAAPYTIVIDGAQIADGPTTLVARAMQGELVAAMKNLEVSVDNTGPVLTHQLPMADELLTEAFTFRVEAADISGIARVDLMLQHADDDEPQLIESRQSQPFATEVDPGAYPSGAVTLSARAEDLLGNSSEVAIDVQFDDGAPRVEITAPGRGSDFDESFEVRIEVEDITGLDAVMVLVNQVETARLDTAPYRLTLDPQDFPEGRQLIEAVATDRLGFEGRDEVQVDFIHPPDTGGGDNGGGNGNGNPDPTPEPEPVRYDTDFVVDTVELGNADEGFDLTGDGVPDNSGGNALRNNLIRQMIGDVDQNMRDAIGSGAMIMLFSTESLDDPEDDPFFWLDYYLGVDLDGNPADNFTGDEEFAVDPQSLDDNGDPMITFPRASVSESVLAAGPDDFQFVFPLTTPPTIIALRRAQITCELAIDVDDPTGSRMLQGMIGGAVPVSQLVPAILAIPAAAPFEDLVRGVIPAFADVDLDGNGQPDAISLAMRYSATRARIQDDVDRDDEGGENP